MLKAGAAKARHRAPRLVRDYPVTTAVTTATALVSTAALRRPEIMDRLRRDKAALKGGQWWRLATPVLVQSYGAGQAVFNLAGSALVGAVVERQSGRARWLAVYAVAGVSGVLASDRWEPDENGSGSSDAVAGLIGAMAVGGLLSDRLPAWPGILYGAYFTASLAGLAALGFEASAAMGAAAVLAAASAGWAGRTEQVRAGLVALCAAAGPTMAAMRDPHGVGLVTGMSVAALASGPELVRRLRGPVVGL